MHLSALGWNSFFDQCWQDRQSDGLSPARVIEEQRESYRLASENGELWAEIAGHFRYSAQNRSAFPAVGDWVAMETIPGEQKGIVHEVLPRLTFLSRKVAGDRGRPNHALSLEQILVANVDVVLIVMPLSAGVSTRLLERYLGTVRAGGAEPVLVLNKADLCADPQKVLESLGRFTAGVRVHILSAATGHGISELTSYIHPGNTVVLLGASGVGKSTMINRLLNSMVQATQEIRAGDGRGRHTTTSRRLFQIPTGGVLIDTPGIRELQLWDGGGLEETFDEIAQLAARCRFRDCLHETEPGCAIRNAIETGALDADRLDNYHKIRRELQHLDARRDAAARSEQKRRWKSATKALRKHYRDSGE